MPAARWGIVLVARREGVLNAEDVVALDALRLWRGRWPRLTISRFFLLGGGIISQNRGLIGSLGMAKGAIFITWGSPFEARRKEQVLRLFDEAKSYFDNLVSAGRIHASRIFLNGTGNTREWAGTFIIEGDVDELRELQRDEALEQFLALGDDIIQNVRVALAIGGSTDEIRGPLLMYAEGLPPFGAVPNEE